MTNAHLGKPVVVAILNQQIRRLVPGREAEIQRHGRAERGDAGVDAGRVEPVDPRGARTVEEIRTAVAVEVRGLQARHALEARAARVVDGRDNLAVFGAAVVPLQGGLTGARRLRVHAAHAVEQPREQRPLRDGAVAVLQASLSGNLLAVDARVHAPTSRAASTRGGHLPRT